MDGLAPNSVEKRWWSRPKGDAHSSVFSLVAFLRKHQKQRRRANGLHQRIVSNDDPAGRGGLSGAELARVRLDGGERTRYMLCLSIVDTAASIVSAAKPTLQYLTQAGDWNLQRKAKNRTTALSGQMRGLRIDELGPKIFRDCAVQDIGVVRGYLHPETKRACLERVLPNSVLVDHNEALHGTPRNLYIVYPINRDRAKELWPKFAGKIELAEGIGADDREDFYLTRESAADSVLVVEAWHLGSEKKPGLHTICVSTADLAYEPYRHQDFPVAVLRYADQPVGWYGQSLVARTKEAQRRCNKIIKKYERCQDLASKCMVVVPRSSGITPEMISDLPGTVVFSEGGKPELLVWDGTPPDLRAELPAVREETLNNEGLSEQQVQGDRIQGVNSAVGIRAADDVQSRRHVHPQRRYERWHLDVAELLGRLNDDAAEDDPDYTVMSQVKRGRRDFIHAVKWRDVQIDANDARLQIFPTSSLSSTPKGRRDDVMGLLQAQMISHEQALELLDLPDLDTETANLLAVTDYARWQVEKVMDDEWDGLIDPILGAAGIQLALDTAHKSYLQACYSEAPDEVLQRLRDYMEDCSDKLKSMAEEAAKQQPSVQPQASPVDPGMPADAGMAADPNAVAQQQMPMPQPGMA